jgi:hypothetical protein
MGAVATKKGEDKSHKRCKPIAQGGCGKLKSRVKDFKPRWGKCEKHREQGLAKDDPKVVKCEECKKARLGFVRQPLCVECDAKRGKKEGKAKKPTKVTAQKKKGKTTEEAPVVTAPPETAPVATAPAPQASPPPVAVAPAPVVHHTAPPASPPTPAPSPASAGGALGAVASLLEAGKEGSADEPAGPAAKALPLLAEAPVGAQGGGTAVSAVLEKPAMEGKKDFGFRGPPPQGPSLIRRGTQGCAQNRSYVQANLTEIKRILNALTTRESRVARAEGRLEEANSRFKQVIGEVRQGGGLEVVDVDLRARYEVAHERREREIARVTNAKSWREFTAKKLRLFLDHALSHTPYTKSRACECGSKCPECNFTGWKREENKNPYARAAVPILRHISRVLEETELCYKLRAKTSDSHQAFEKLLATHTGVVKKFGNPHQTAMEGDDAEQGAMMGLLDGAIRFDPTKPDHYLCPVCDYQEKIVKTRVVDPKTGKKKKRFVVEKNKPCPNKKCESKSPMMVQTSTATFQTVAWSWSKRNSRARKTTDERPGLRPSIDDPGLGGKKAEDGGLADQVTMVGGRAQIANDSAKLSDTLGIAGLDLHAQIADLEDETQKTVLRLVMDNHTPSEIALELGLSNRQVTKIRDAAFAVLRDRLAGYLGRVRGNQVEEEVEV